MSSFAESYLAETAAIAEQLDASSVERLATELAAVRDGGGRLFVLGVGGSAAHASHAACDFRKLCHFEAYAPTDNVAELTARTNDDGWEDVFASWLQGSRLDARDAVLVFSVGGGDEERGVSANLVRGVDHAQRVGAKVFGVVGRDGGYVARAADVSVLVPTVNEERVTAHTEGMCAVVWHLLVSHPALQAQSPEVGVAPLTGRASASGRRWLVVGGAGFIGGHFVRAPAVRPRRRAGHRLRQLHVGPRGAPRRRRRRPEARGRSRRREGARGARRRRRRARRRRTPRVESRHRTRCDRARHRLRRGDAADAPRARGAAARVGGPDPLRVGERRLRRHRRDRGRRGPRPADPHLDLRREQARGRGAHLRVQLHVRAHGPRVPIRKRRGPVADARRGTRLRAQAARGSDPARDPRRRLAEQVVRLRRRRHRRDAASRARPPSRSAPSTSRPATTSRSRRSRELAVEASASIQRASASSTSGGDRGWKGDVPIVRLSIERMRQPRVVASPHLDGGAAATRWRRSSMRSAPAGCERGRRAVFLDRDGVLDSRASRRRPPTLDPERRGARARARRSRVVHRASQLPASSSSS